MLKNTIRALCVLIIPFFGLSQSNEKQFSISELQEDFNFWRSQLETRSPLLYYYNTKASTDHYFDSVYTRIDHPMSAIEFYNLIAPASFFLKDVHSGVQTNLKIEQSIIDHSSIIPIDIVWIENSAIVAVSDTMNSIPRGSQVLSINGVKTKEIFQRGLQLFSNDGYSTASSTFNTNANFWLFYHRIYGHSDQYTFEVLNDVGTIETITIQGTGWKSIWKSKNAANRPMFKDDLPLITLDFNDTLQTALLTVRSFHNGLFKECNQGKFDPQIKAALQAIEDYQPAHLILDIRANGGGDPINGKLILQYLLENEFHITRELRVVKDPEAESFYARTKTVQWPFYGLGSFKPNKQTFRGHVYTLIDGGTSSAAGEFSGVLQRESNTIFIGSETGGSPALVGGTYLKQELLLPNTLLNVSVCTICSVNDDLENHNGYGVYPDYPINWTASDFETLNDPVLSFTYDLISKVNQQEQQLIALKDSINRTYGLYEGAPAINSGPCGNFANLFYEAWNSRFDEKVTISFIMSADSSECYHVLVKLPNGDYYDGGNGILTRRQLIEGYEKGMYIIDMLEYDYELLDEMSYGLVREYPRCINYSAQQTSEVINFYLNQLQPIDNSMISQLEFTKEDRLLFVGRDSIENKDVVSSVTITPIDSFNLELKIEILHQWKTVETFTESVELDHHSLNNDIPYIVHVNDSLPAYRFFNEAGIELIIAKEDYFEVSAQSRSVKPYTMTILQLSLPPNSTHFVKTLPLMYSK